MWWRVPSPLPLKSATSEIVANINIRRTTVRTTFSITYPRWQKFCTLRTVALRRSGHGAAMSIEQEAAPAFS
jgi:hypothetical protein